MSHFEAAASSFEGGGAGGGGVGGVVEGDGGFRFPPQNQAQIVSEKGVTTEIICTSYADRHFVVISQVNKFGNLLTAWSESKGDGASEKIYEVQSLLGKRDDVLLNVYARQIIERISATSDKPLLLALSLKPEGRDAETFRDILNKLFEIATW